MTRLRYTMFVVTVFLALALSAMITVPALADDSAPPPTETPTEATPPVAADPAPVTDGSTEELLTQIPEGTELVVVNDEGEAVPLASQEAAQLVETADPMWCPAGVNPGAITCSMGYTSLSQLVTDFNDGAGGLTSFTPNGNGVIWMQKDADPGLAGTSIVMNGSIGGFIGIANFSLTLKGGWNGCNPGCVNTVDIAHPSIFDQSLSITNWNGDITLSDITFTGVTLGSASNNAALNIQTTKKITLKNVNVNTNTGAGTVNGAWLDNADAAPLVFGDVSITNSNFKNNKNAGLTINSEGIITLAGVLVTGNGTDGATLDNSFAATAKAVNITTGTNEFSNNSGTFGDGLNITSNGVITLKDINANNNGEDGIRLENSNDIFSSGINLIGATIASGNGYVGIEVYSDGAVTASNLVTNSNGSNGIFFDNRDAGTLGVTIGGSSNQFKFNGGTGILVLSGGAITLNSINVNSNGANGAYLDNSESTAGSSVTLTGTNSFRENYSTGLAIYSTGVVTLSNITANDNGTNPVGGDGMSVDNSGASTPKAVTLTGFNQFNGNYGGGLMVLSQGAITISNLTASFNQIYHGAYLKNDYGPSPQNVTLTGTVNVNNNGQDGLYVTSLGVISIGSITANNNGGSGVNLSNASGTVPKAVTLSGASNHFNGNNSHGLYIASLGTVTLNNVTASDNTNGYGLYVNNSWSGSVGGITLNGTSSFLLNGYSGIEMYSSGNILIKDLDVEGNGILEINGDGHGAYLRNNYIGSTATITVGTNNANWFNEFSGNFNSGLEVYSNGTVTVSNITASGNGLDNGVNTYGYGLYVNNTSAATPKAVTLLGKNEFNGNHNEGLRIATKGAVTLNKITANNNGGRGALISNNANNLVPQNVTLNGYGNFLGNGDDGLVIATFGTIITNNLTANDNGTNAGSLGYGAWLDNCSYNGTDCNALTAKSVTVNGTNTFNNNHLDGLLVQTLGFIKANNVTASNNDRNGAVLNNGQLFGYIGVTLTGTNVFENNGFDGLDIATNGVVSLNNISANGNIAGEGLAINAYNDDSPIGNNGPPNITLTGINSFKNNGGKGLYILSNGVVTLSNVTANGNGAEGAYINNFIATPYRWEPLPANSISLLGVNNFNGNGLDGLYFYTYSGTSIINITADDNGGDGVEGYSIERGVTISCGSMTNNTGVGWRLYALTTISLKGVFTINNTAGSFVNLGGALVTPRTCP